MSPSYQLPDLLSLCRPFELRTNVFCRPAMIASEAWLLGLKTTDLNDVLTETERTSLHATKTGLLAGLCVPSCGQPQLRFFADFLSFLIIADGRIKRAGDAEGSGWMDGDTESGIDSLTQHELFQYLRPEFLRLVARADPSWDTRFAASVHSYRSAQLQVITSRLSNVIPDLETYISLRRDLSGLYMILDLIELSENLNIPLADDGTSKKVAILKQLTADIIGCSLDVFTFNIDQAQGNRHNIITILMENKRLSLQGALNFAGALIKQFFNSFLETEKSLFCHPTPPQTNHSGTGTLSSYWNWITSVRLATPPASPPPGPQSSNMECGGDTCLGDLPSYVQTLKDCIVGTINWAYETELYFGRKGEEIRTFGWVFFNPKVIGEEHS
ncbi:hypothetical protein D9615_008650 [Tricholomella constricta]|uniref:Terpenoid synthase n=1 Tax=Tricholomella constricta TaxID=117010 RepID=A0A8H5M0K5_9AGAR|nr:hypothetical protein D9615_008650 [Tricholomella constricta]